MTYNKMCCSQVILNDSLSLSENKPDINTILRTKCTPLIKEVITDKQYIIIYGELTSAVEYTAIDRDGSQPVYFTSFKSHFAAFLIPDNTTKSKKNYSVKVEYAQFEKAGPRLINNFIILRAYPRNSETLYNPPEQDRHRYCSF